MNGTISSIEGQGSIKMDRQGFDDGRTASTKRCGPGKAHGCDGCGEVRQDVDLWAADPETGEEVWLCEECADG